MMRSLYSAVSGLRTHQTRMDVIGNNIANVNTEAFKASSVRFSEIMYQTTSAASGGDGALGIGGKNAKQIGLGVTTGSTTVSITSQGASESTGNPFDLKLTDSQSTNFFIVSDGSNTFFTRAGDFYVDGNGFLCMASTGYTLQGWQIDQTTGEIKKDTVSALQVMSAKNQTSAPEATQAAYASGVLDKNESNVASASGYTMTVMIYDDLGYSYTAKFAVKNHSNGDNPKDFSDGKYSIELTDILKSDGTSMFYDKDGKLLKDETTGDPLFGDLVKEKYDVDADGKKTETDDPLGALFKKQLIEFDQNKGTFITIGEYSEDKATAKEPPLVGGDAQNNAEVVMGLAQLLTATQSADGNTSNFKNVTINFNNLMNYNKGGASTAKLNKGDVVGHDTGKKLGALTGISVDSAGMVWGSYDNGNTNLLCQIAVAQFANASGLEKVGNNCYQTTLNSGEFDGIGVEINADGSTIDSGVLEMSNVDLSAQFTDMIVTQRGFQANSRVITTSDSLLEELINLKR